MEEGLSLKMKTTVILNEVEFKAIQIDIDEFTCSLNTYWKEI